MEIKDFSSFIDREKGRSCLVAGNGPSLKDFPFERFDGIYILTGSGPQLLEHKVRQCYWVVANHIHPVAKSHLREINSNPKNIFIFADSMPFEKNNSYDHDFLVNNLCVDWFSFDERHFNGKKCDPEKACCRVVDLYPGRLTFQEFMEQHFQVPSVNRSIGTAVQHSLALAILMGCDPIYLIGIDLPLYSKNYTYYRTLRNWQTIRMTLRAVKNTVKGCFNRQPIPSDFFHCMDDMLESFRQLVQLCHRQGIKIFNLSKTSTLNRIQELPYEDPQKICEGCHG